MKTIGEGYVASYATPNPFILNKICLNQDNRQDNRIDGSELTLDRLLCTHGVMLHLRA
jgi:hypothetical protein